MKTISISIPTTGADLGAVVTQARELLGMPFAMVGIGFALIGTEIMGGDVRTRMRAVLLDAVLGNSEEVQHEAQA